jgi:hypothetical protein
VDCAGLDLRIFPDNITRAARHLSLQVRAGDLRGRHRAGFMWEVHMAELNLPLLWFR